MHNVIVLGIAQFFAAIGQVTVVALGGLIGAALAPDPRLATLPVSCAVLGVALATLPAALAMPRFGRRRVFICGVLLAAAGAIAAAGAVATSSFVGYCLASMLLGANLAFTAQFRFAAAESVAPEYVSRVIAWVMLGIIAAAIVGPRLVVSVRNWTEVEYLASFLTIALTYGLSALSLLRFKNPVLTPASADGEGRPLRVIAAQPAFLLAVSGAAVGYGIMALIMTATPLSMHVMDGHSVEETTAVIQGHFLAMYAPSLVSGWLVARLGIIRMLALGALLEAACVAFAISGREVMHYAWAMIALGIGWNLMFVASTTLLTRCYRPVERFRVQALNDFCMFGVMATASLLAGVLINSQGWDNMNLLALVPLALIVGAAASLSRRLAPLEQATTG
ncbi:MAG: MFS transporter [Gammaproteobacteria bacterium]